MRRAFAALAILIFTVAHASGEQSISLSEDAPFVWPIPAWMAPPPVPEDNPMTSAKVELGRRLFYDARLSRMALLPVPPATIRPAPLPTDAHWP